MRIKVSNFKLEDVKDLRRLFQILHFRVLSSRFLRMLAYFASVSESGLLETGLASLFSIEVFLSCATAGQSWPKKWTLVES
jgi:hypothetical protein